MNAVAQQAREQQLKQKQAAAAAEVELDRLKGQLQREKALQVLNNTSLNMQTASWSDLHLVTQHVGPCHAMTMWKSSKSCLVVSYYGLQPGFLIMLIKCFLVSSSCKAVSRPVTMPDQTLPEMAVITGTAMDPNKDKFRGCCNVDLYQADCMCG